MTTPPPAQKKQTIQEIWNKLLSFSTIVLLNLLLIFVFGSYTVYKTLIHQNEDFQKVYIAITPPKPPPQANSEPQLPKQISPDSTLDPQPEIATPPLAANIATANMPVSDTFKVHVDPSITVNRMANVFAMPQGAGRGAAASSGDTSSTTSSSLTNPFGDIATEGAGMLLGRFYDLKQTPDRKPTGINKKGWADEMTRFIASGFDTALFQKYYQAKITLTTGCFNIPIRQSTDAPKAFKVQSEVAASLWCVYYEGFVAAPDDGDYTFAGYADNAMVVAIDGKLVLDAGYTVTTKDPLVQTPVKGNWSPTMTARHDGHVIYRIGKKFRLNKGQKVHMQVLIGDDGGITGFFLFLKTGGETYNKSSIGDIFELPYFHLTPNYPKVDGEQPPHAADGPAWISVGQ